MNLLSICEYIYANKDIQRIIMMNNTSEDMIETLLNAAFEFQIPEIYLFEKNSRDNIDIELASVFLSSGMYNVLKKWIIDDIQKSPEDISSILYNIIFRQSSQIHRPSEKL